MQASELYASGPLVLSAAWHALSSYGTLRFTIRIDNEATCPSRDTNA